MIEFRRMLVSYVVIAVVALIGSFLYTLACGPKLIILHPFIGIVGSLVFGVIIYIPAARFSAWVARKIIR